MDNFIKDFLLEIQKTFSLLDGKIIKAIINKLIK